MALSRRHFFFGTLLAGAVPTGGFGSTPLLCTVTFGAPLVLEPGEGSMPFRERSRQALLALAPSGEE